MSKTVLLVDWLIQFSGVLISKESAFLFVRFQTKTFFHYKEIVENEYISTWLNTYWYTCLTICHTVCQAYLSGNWNALAYTVIVHASICVCITALTSCYTCVKFSMYSQYIPFVRKSLCNRITNFKLIDKQRQYMT